MDWSRSSNAALEDCRRVSKIDELASKRGGGTRAAKAVGATPGKKGGKDAKGGVVPVQPTIALEDLTENKVTLRGGAVAVAAQLSQLDSASGGTRVSKGREVRLRPAWLRCW